MMDSSKLQKTIPHLNEYGKDMDSWMEEFNRVMEIFDVNELRRIFIWTKKVVDCDIKELINSLAKRRNNEIRYPKTKEIQAAIEEYLEITQNEKFEDYLNAIKQRAYPHSQVIISECETLREAFKVTERAEKAKRKTISENTNIYNVNMITQNPTYPTIMSNPIYKNLANSGNNYYNVGPYNSNLNENTAFYNNPYANYNRTNNATMGLQLSNVYNQCLRQL
ncbi:hypothetical protein PIROE2DRAFT_56711 [Piromyces sp. E2]|nr:hypothetical protein PIROE2DRAFT_56711 [Piromyces sp. E2]|eukprot:OUM70674.1 hypothetical protein PIROE2DRAFT_56711 [Piromyces sp. E2]